MKIEKKKGVEKIRIVGHNKTLLYVIIFLLIVLGFVIYGIVQLNKNSPASNGTVIIQNGSIECRSDADCVESSCCHATSCVAKPKAPVCKSVMCTMDCRSNSLDCGQGSCVCTQGKCDVKWSS
jgi:hypothetical protein